MLIHTISALVSLGFIIGWGPYTVVSLWASFRGEVMLPMWATPLPVILAKSSIAYNPFIYIFFTVRYREDFTSLCRYWIRSYSKVTTGKSSITRRGPSSQNTNGNTANTSMKVSPGYSRNSSLLTRQPTTTTATNSYNNLTPNHATSYPKQDEQPVPSQTHLDQEADKQNNFTANVLNSINPSVQRSTQDLSIVIVGETD
ncbi:Opsin-5 [Orchesella cincta]|uniref:Opsin-5 n=1 Tax=Orchesella cincta TaxID=48709 RepID=A0A1D2MZA9_ORCCI|nr:Opsin-5 [Orchesella cincta]